MLHTFSRPLTDSEVRRINAEIRRIGNASSAASRVKEVLQVAVVALIAGVGYGLFFPQFSQYAVAGALVLGAILLAILWFESWRKSRARLRGLRSALQVGSANVVYVAASGYAAFTEYEDLGALYVFQTEPNTLFVLNGQDYYENRRFPCLEFELVDVPGAFYSVRPLSLKVEPVVTYTDHEMFEVARIENQRTLDGEVSNAFRVLKNAVA